MNVLRTLLASSILLVIGGTVLMGATDRFQAFTTETARRIDIREHPRQVPPAILQTQTGAQINLTDLRGSWLLVDFIYTRCLTYCSLLGGEFAQLQTQLATPIKEGKLRLLSISFDPTHDKPPQLAAYLEIHRDHGTGWLAARPVDTDELTRLEQVFGVTVISDGLGGFVHNAAIGIVNPQGQLVEIFPLGNPEPVGRAVLQYMQ
ncbi:MAG TPA: SCO family protein [Gammaproteobacteria bacterium]|nr:SCO family protein [Gammaproteobacteria bacterium]